MCVVEERLPGGWLFVVPVKKHFVKRAGRQKTPNLTRSGRQKNPI
jgi:hypothetical protein